MDNEKEGFPITAIREIKILKMLKHPNIVCLKEIVTSKHEKSNIYMVMEYLDHDLSGLTDENLLGSGGNNLLLGQVKLYMQQALEGLRYLHKNKILHRDIKSSNLLVSNKHELKIADFGLARPVEASKKYTNRVITLWYRPPELLLGANVYDTSIDMWSIGCLLGELLAGKPIFPGKTEIDQLKRIFEICGTPSSSDWPEHDQLKEWTKRKPDSRIFRRLTQIFSSLDSYGLDLMDKLLVLNPKKRLSAEEALRHDFFTKGARVSNPKDLPTYKHSCHELDAKEARKRKNKRPAPSTGNLPGGVFQPAPNQPPPPGGMYNMRK
eukprot:TRINITY_DN20026_c0_g1_i1.p1 TRINITY_DN20026_c0_g1~~TRINITY_DN20026_c0_g1_i1.p1  ORF type:complete len:323 (+),score=37.54 TRINITY_DN20026_c0_g1_i1:299-1267(+)